MKTQLIDLPGGRLGEVCAEKNKDLLIDREIADRKRNDKRFTALEFRKEQLRKAVQSTVEVLQSQRRMLEFLREQEDQNENELKNREVEIEVAVLEEFADESN